MSEELSEQEKQLKEAAEWKEHYLETHTKEQLFDRIEQLINMQHPNMGPYVADPKFSIRGGTDSITFIRRSGGRAQIWVDYGREKKPLVLTIQTQEQFDEFVAFLESKDKSWKF